MKAILASFCKSALIFILAAAFATPSQAADIASQADLEAIGATAVGTYRQTADIDLAAYAGGLSNFSGVFDGGNYKISGLDKPLFESLSGNAVVRNVNLDTVAISVLNTDTGALAATTAAGSSVTIVNVQTSGDITVTGAGEAGGLVGKSEGNVQIISSTNTATVSASDGNAGGLVGKSEGTLTVLNSANQGTVESNSGNAGGISGTTQGVTNISNSQNSGAVETVNLGASAGGLIGNAKDETSITNVSVSGNTSSINGVSGGVVGKADTSIEITNASVTGTSTSVNSDAGGIVAKADVDIVVVDSNAAAVSTINGNAGGIAATVSGNAALTEVTSSGATTINGHAGGILGQVTGSTSVAGGIVNGNVSTINGSAGGIVAISTNSATLNETDVQGNVETVNGNAGGIIAVTNSTASVTDANYTGNVSSILGAAAGVAAAAIGTVTLNTVTVTGNVSTINGESGGAIASTDGNASLTQVSATSNVSSINGTAGGLIGLVLENATIEQSFAIGSATTINNHAGGLVANVGGDLEVANSFARVPTSTVVSAAGGIVGGVGGDLSINNSYATGSVSTILASAGGLAGQVTGNTSITSASSTGNVSTINGEAGGLIGDGGAIVNIANTKATGDVSSINGNVGGLLGSSGKSVTDQNMLAGVNNLNDEALTEVNSREANINSTTTVSISNSSATGNLSTIGGSVGGLIGKVESEINGTATVVMTVNQTNNVNMNLGVDIEANTETNVNATVGVVITNSFSTSNVSTINGDAGGLIGTVDLDVNLITRSVLEVTSNSNGAIRAISSVRRQVDSSLNVDIRESYASGSVSTIAGNAGGIIGQSQHNTTETVQSTVTITAFGAPELTFNNITENDATYTSRFALNDSYSTSVATSVAGIADSLYAEIDGTAAEEQVEVDNVYGVGDEIALLAPIEEIAGLDDYVGLDPSTVATKWSPLKIWGNCPDTNAGLPFLNVFYTSGPCGNDEVANINLERDIDMPEQFRGTASEVDALLGQIVDQLSQYLEFKNNLASDTVMSKIDTQNRNSLEVLLRLPDYLQILDSNFFPTTLLIRVPDGKWFRVSIASLLENRATALNPIEFKMTGIYYFYFVADNSYDSNQEDGNLIVTKISNPISSVMIQVVDR